MSFERWCCQGCARENGASRKSCRTCGTRVGTDPILGLMTVAELRDLLRAKDYQLKVLDRAAVSHGVWSDDARMADWNADFAALQARYATARRAAQLVIDAAEYNPIDDSLLPASAEFDGVMRALRKNWDGKTGGALAKGDMSELSARLEADGGAPDYSGTPQPRIDSDAALRIYKAADVIVRTIEKPGGVPLWAWGLGAVGLLVAVRSR